MRNPNNSRLIKYLTYEIDSKARLFGKQKVPIDLGELDTLHERSLGYKILAYQL